MTSPNIASLVTIVGLTSYIGLTTTSPTVLLSNPASSNSIYKINYINVSNGHGASAVNITMGYHTAAAGAGTSIRLASTISVPANSSLILLDKPLYLEENRSLVVTSNPAYPTDIVCSYETIS